MSSQVPEPGPDDEQAATSPGDAAADGRAATSPGDAAVDGRAATSPSGLADSGRAVGSADGPPWVAWVEGSELSGPCQTPDGSVGGVWPDGLDYQALLEALAAGGFLDGRDEDQDAELADELAAEADGRMGPPDPAWAAALAVEHMDPGPAMAGWLKVATGAAGRLDENGLAGVTIAAQKMASWAQAAGLDAVAQITSRAAAADNKIGVHRDGRPARLCRDAIGQVSLTLMLTDYSAAAWADLAIMLAWRLPATRAALAAGRVDFYRAKLIAEATAVLSEDKARQVEAKVLPEAGGQTPAHLRARLRQAVIAADPEGAEQRRKDAERAADVRLYAEDDQTATMVASKQPQIELAAGYARVTAMARARMAAGLPGNLAFHRSQILLGLLLGTLPPTPPAEGAPPDQPPPSDTDGDPRPGSDGDPGGAAGPDGGGEDGGPADDLPAPSDEDAPADDGLDDTDTDDGPGGFYDPAEEDDQAVAVPVPPWPALGVIPPALARPAAVPDGRPVPGLLDVTLPWATLAGLPGGGPGILGRIGPITPAQARQLAAAAEHDPAAQWRVIVTNRAGQAIAVTRIRRRIRAGPAPPGAGLVGRATLVISQDTIGEHTQAARSRSPGSHGNAGPPGEITAAALRAAAKALDRAVIRAQADAAAGGCAHTDQSPGYRPPPRLREFVTARDVTCRGLACRQPAWRADLDHTIPYDQGGRTCRCNFGGGCRKHHILKQHPRWKLEQTRPGMFTWTTPAGRTYTTGPDVLPL